MFIFKLYVCTNFIFNSVQYMIYTAAVDCLYQHTYKSIYLSIYLTEFITVFTTTLTNLKSSWLREGCYFHHLILSYWNSQIVDVV